jgi:NAD(P)-dependent dehydrogenase (short-subunit alcohol dehydrogenase family)
VSGDAGRPLALITGGCRRLGAAISAALAQAGYDLALHGGHSVDPDPMLVKAIGEAGVNTISVFADLADPAAVAGLLGDVVGHFGRAPDVLVNNAARFDYDSPSDVSQQSLVDHYKVNTAAPILLTQALARIAGEGTVIVNILDQRVAAPNADQFSYTLSKLALSEATAILARHYAPRIRVCAVAPGLTLSTPDFDGDRLAAAARHMPLAHLPEPAEIADAIMYLVAARSVTGQTIFVDAGAHLCRYDRDFPFLDEGGGEGRGGL